MGQASLAGLFSGFIRLLAVYVSLLDPKEEANIGVLYHFIKQMSKENGQK